MADFADTLLAGRRVLVVTPHADDETFGCGGTMARAADLGAQVYVIVGSIADLHQYANGFDRVSGDTREDELRAAFAVLGVQDYCVLYRDEPDTPAAATRHLRLDAVPRVELIGLLERECPLAIDKVKPDILLFPAVSYNQDHEALNRAVWAACRPHLPSDKPFVRAVWAYDQPQLGWNHAAFRPNLYVDISRHLDRKLAAFRCHASQVRPDPHHASVENMERLARLRGSEVSVAAAEAFECHRLLL